MHRLLTLALIALPLAAQNPIRVGIIGTDTSHVPAFTQVLNDPAHPKHVPGAKVVAAYKGGSDDVESSYQRVDRYAEEIHAKYGVEIVPTIEALLGKVDAVLLESVDGRKHLEQARPVLAAGKPVFIDKPLAATLADAKEIARLGEFYKTPWWSSSSLRYGPGMDELTKAPVGGAITWGPASIHNSHPLDLSWYAIHPIELLYTLMGPGCVQVSRTYTEGTDVITGVWEGGRVGVVRGIRKGKSGYGAVVFGEKEIKVEGDAGSDYAAMLVHVVQFFKDGKPPVANAETVEIFEFMDAALRSRNSGGAAIRIR